MRVQRGQRHGESPQEELIRKLQGQIDQLSADNHMLRQQLEQKEQFLAMIAHELRNLLAPIINYAQMIARQVPSSQKRSSSSAEEKRNASLRRHTNIIVSQARRLSRLVNDLLDASRLSSGQFTLVRESCDIVALARESVEHLRPVAPYHTLVVEASEEAIVGQWDGGRLQQALGNLLDNAIKYSDEHTTVTTRIWRSSSRVHVSVHNQGIAIPKEDIGQLFRPYTRLRAAGGRQGSGLGLYITKSIIEAHEGELHLEPHTDDDSKEAARGTTFSFTLPLT
ncbi:MAG: HAMP domain-containing histidine kinase [Ktedonobacteraceae bacterium]|nr:HAMP domain-containing histidine kinase [Ktedonobacteraceae bacterium]